MIKKIKTINNLAVFDNFDWDSCVQDPRSGHPLLFEKINILYGRNYSGKTTLSRILRTLETQQLPEKYQNPKFEIILDDGSLVTQTTIDSANVSVRVFNEDFVRTNLRFLIDPDSDIAPFAILGANNAKIEKVIKDLEAEIGSNVEGKETGLYKQSKDAKKAEIEAKAKTNDMMRKLESKLSDKATNQRTGIKYNVDRFGDQNYTIARIRQDIATVISRDYLHLTAEKKAEYENTIKEQTKPQISPIAVPNLQIRIFFRKAAELLSRKIGSSNKILELLHDAALNIWVKKGKSLLNGKDVCAFCGNPISKGRWKEINAHFDEESIMLEEDIDALLIEINLEKKQLQISLNIDKTAFYTKYFSDVDAFLGTGSKAIQEYCSAIDSAAEQLLARKTQITIATQFNEPADNSGAVQKLFEGFNIAIEANNEFSSTLSVAKTAAQQALRLQEVADFCSTIGYVSKMNDISILRKESNSATLVAGDAENILKQKIQQFQEKLRQLHDEEEGARQVNKYLNNYFGHNFVTLEAEYVTEGEKRIRFRILRNGLPAFNLSEGECRLISFCYFIAKLDDVNTSGKKSIIWIDDPISSLDANHIYFMYSMIATQIVETKKFEQLFISTHNLEFLKYLRRLNIDNERKQYFFIEREGALSRIIKMPKYLANHATEFNYLFSIIYKCSKCEAVTDANYDMLHGFGNNARKFLELLLYFQYPDDSEKPLIKLKRFFGTEEIPPILMDRMLNEDSHGPSPERALKVDIDPETIPVARRVVEKLRENEAQYSALLKSIGETV